MTSSHFRYFILAYYVITLCIIATGLATQKVEEIYSTKLKTAKNRDSLTGALNNAGLKEIMDKWVNEKREFSVVMLDIDNFKDVNDTMGHQIGDEYIKNIAKVLNRYTNDDMSFGRYGGDEFTVIKTKNKISSAAFLGLLKNQFANDPKYPMSISFGEASYHEGKDLEQVIYNADEALYYSKSHGKNCFTLYEDIRDENISIYNLSKERVIGHYMNFADKILTSLLVVDFKGKILQANKAFLKLIDVDSIKNINLETDDKEAIQFEDGDVALVKTKRTINNHQYSFNERFVAFRNEEGKIDYIISMIENEDN
jgi:diguanylate cyclase (GGDEF)-like protein